MKIWHAHISWFEECGYFVYITNSFKKLLLLFYYFSNFVILLTILILTIVTCCIQTI